MKRIAAVAALTFFLTTGCGTQVSHEIIGESEVNGVTVTSCKRTTDRQVFGLTYSSVDNIENCPAAMRQG